MYVCVLGPRCPLHLLAGGAVRGCVLWPGLLPRPATPGWGVGACVCLCARPDCTPPFLAGVCCGGVRAGLCLRLCPAPLGWVVGMCVRSCVCPACTPRFLGGRLWRGAVRVLLWPRFAPPLPFGFCFYIWGGRPGAWCRRFVVSVAGCPGLGFRGLRPPVPTRSSCAFMCLLCFFCPSVVCVRVFRVSLLPVGRCSRFGVAGLCWVVLWCFFGGLVFGAVWVGDLADSFGVGGGFCGCGPFSRTPPLFFLFGGGGLPVPPSALRGLMHALAGIQCSLPGCCWCLRFARPCPGPMGRVGYVHVWLGVPSCRVRFLLCGLDGCARGLCEALLLWGLGFSESLRLRGAGMNFLVAVRVGRPPSLLPGARWPLAGAWRACGAASGVCGCLSCLVPRLASLALVLWCAVVRRAASCRFSPCCVVLVHAVLQCALPGRAVLRRVVPWPAALCRVASRRVVACCALNCLVVVRCTVARYGAVCSAASCNAVVGRWRSV